MFLSASKSGPEIGVAAYKGFTGQVSLAYAILDRIKWRQGWL